VFVAILSWITGSLFYLYMNTPLVFDPTGTGNDYSRFGNFGIQLRNIFTFFATTLFTLYSVYSGKTQVENFQDKRITSKLGILNLEVIMTNKLPFDFFRNFVQNHSKDYLVYLNLYCLIELYRKKLSSLLIHANALKK
jgi:hypothetical protein